MIDVHKSKKQEETVVGLTYTKRWNVVDFVGKYHLSRFENQHLPLPGTQIKIERDHIKAKEDDVNRFRRELNERSEVRRHRNDVRMRMVEFSTGIYFDSVIGTQIAASEQILNEREELVNKVPRVLDAESDINEFFKNIELGKHHFVAHAIRNGFRSIDYQDPATGDCALHIAVRNGFPKCVEELLLYRADCDVKNNIGMYPVHFAWRFWKFHKYRSKEEREDQERRTSQILQTCFSFGAFVDAVDQDGLSCLHIACQHKDVRTVKMLLFFRADPFLKTKAGLNAMEIAQKHQRNEIFGLLSLFAGMGKLMVQFDFTVLWQKFLADYEAAISEGTSTEAVLFQLSMDEKISSVTQTTRPGMFPIDDNMLRQVYRESLECSYAIKPWDLDWKGFVADYAAKISKSKKSQAAAEKLEKKLGMSDRSNDGDTEVVSTASKDARSPSHSKPRTRKLPSLPTPEPRARSAYSSTVTRGGGTFNLKSSSEGFNSGSFAEFGSSRSVTSAVDAHGDGVGPLLSSRIGLDSGSATGFSCSLGEGSFDRLSVKDWHADSSTPRTGRRGSRERLSIKDSGTSANWGSETGDPTRRGSAEELAILAQLGLTLEPSEGSGSPRRRSRERLSIKEGGFDSGQRRGSKENLMAAVSSKPSTKDFKLALNPHAIAKTRRRSREKLLGVSSRSGDSTDSAGKDDGSLSARLFTNRSSFDDGDVKPATARATGSSLEGSGQHWDAFFVDPSPTESRPVSQLRSRYLDCARAISLDGKFESTTKRPSTSSVLMVSHRKPEAPLRGTEEESSVLRAITSQGKDFDTYEMSKSLIPKHLRLMQSEAPLEISILGEYQKQDMEFRSKERDEMFGRLSALPTRLEQMQRDQVSKKLEEDIALSDTASRGVSPLAGQTSPAPADQSAGKIIPIRKEKIDMVNNNRARFVSKKLLPPSRIDSVVGNMAKEYRAKVEKEKMRRIGLSSIASAGHAKNDLAAMIMEQQQLNSSGHAAGTPSTPMRQDQDAKMRALLAGEVVKYGKGRLTSTHKTKIKLEDPWSTVSGR